jgi:hypothetical protein
MSCLRPLLIFILAAGCMALGEAADTTCKVEVPVTVLTEALRPEIVTRTTLEGFTATLDGHPIKVSGLRADSASHRFVLVMDQSGSIREKLWPGELTLAKHFAASLSSTSQAGLISFNEVIQSKVPLTSGMELAGKLKQIEKARPKGRTSIYTAIGEAIDLLESSQQGDIIYLLSDGGENSLPLAKWNMLRDRLQRSGIRLFAMILVDDHFGAPQYSSTSMEQEGWSNVRSLILDSGGAYSLLSYSRSHNWNEKLMSDAAYIFYREMVYDYLLEMDIPKSSKAAMKLNLKFENPQNRKERYRIFSTSRIFNRCLSQ